MSGLLRTLRGITFDAGREFTVVLVSIDPRETPVVAARAKETWLRKYDRPGSEAGWNFLTGEEASIKALAKAVGYHYRYDAERDQFAHPAGIMIATPEGKLARYFYGLQYPPRDVRLGIIEASDRRIAAPADQVLLLCMQYDPATGQYGLAIVRAVRAGGVVTLAVLIYLILGMVRQERAKLRRGQS